MSIAAAGTSRSAPFLFGSAGVITAVAALATAALAFTGGVNLEPAAAPAPAAHVAATASWSPSPASSTLSAALDQGPEGWAKNGQLQRNVTAPAPYSCPLPGISSTTSFTQSYTASGTRIQVTVQAFTAGLGAEATVLQSANAAACAGSSAGLYISGLFTDGPGVVGENAAVSRGGVRTQVTAFRRGDVLAYVSGQDPSKVLSLAAVLDAHLDTKLDGVCVNEDSSVEDGRRSPFSSSGYSQHARDAEVAIPEVKKPVAPKVDSAPVPKVELPAPVLIKDPVSQTPVPEHPVAPDMPEFMEFPEAPRAPAAKATTVTNVKVPADDLQGPGCGWDFTGMRPPVFNEDVAAETALRTMSEAKTVLERNAAAWQTAVSDYWISYNSYRESADLYRAYAVEVTKVNEAWAKIAEQWEEYHRLLTEYEEAVSARDDFIKRQDEARDGHKAEIKRCEVEMKAAEEAARKARQEKEKPVVVLPADPSTPPAPAAPTVPAEPVPAPAPSGCPAQEPPILSEPVPDEPSKPSEPADPRG